MTSLYRITLNLNIPHVWHIDTGGNDPKYLVDALATMTDLIRYSEWAQDDQGVWWLMVEWKIPYDGDTVYERLNTAIVAALDGAIVLHGMAS